MGTPYLIRPAAHPWHGESSRVSPFTGVLMVVVDGVRGADGGASARPDVAATGGASSKHQGQGGSSRAGGAGYPCTPIAQRGTPSQDHLRNERRGPAKRRPKRYLCAGLGRPI